MHNAVDLNLRSRPFESEAALVTDRAEIWFFNPAGFFVWVKPGAEILDSDIDLLIGPKTTAYIHAMLSKFPDEGWFSFYDLSHLENMSSEHRHRVVRWGEKTWRKKQIKSMYINYNSQGSRLVRMLLSVATMGVRMTGTPVISTPEIRGRLSALKPRLISVAELEALAAQI